MNLILARLYFTVPEAAALWRVSVPTIYRRVASGDIPCVRVGGENGPIRIPASAFPELSPSGDVPVSAAGPEPVRQSSRRQHAGGEEAA